MLTLAVKYYGGDPRMKFIVSPDGSALTFDVDKELASADDESVVNLVDLTFDAVVSLLRDRGVKTAAEADSQASQEAEGENRQRMVPSQPVESSQSAPPLSVAAAVASASEVADVDGASADGDAYEVGGASDVARGVVALMLVVVVATTVFLRCSHRFVASSKAHAALLNWARSAPLPFRASRRPFSREHSSLASV